MVEPGFKLKHLPPGWFVITHVGTIYNQQNQDILLWDEHTVTVLVQCFEMLTAFLPLNLVLLCTPPALFLLQQTEHVASFASEKG